MSEREAISVLLGLHAKDLAQQFLKEKGLRYSGDWGKVGERIQQGLDTGDIAENELIELIDRLEESGNQHIFLYRCTEEHLQEIEKVDYLPSKLTDLGIENVYNTSVVLDMPDEPRLVSVRQTDQYVKFKWVEKRVWKELLNETEQRTGSRIIVTREYEVKEARGVIILKIDIVTGITEFRIQRFKPKDRENNYQTKLEFYWEQAAQFLNTQAFSRLNMVTAVDRLNDLNFDEVTRRQSREMTGRGNILDAKSKGKDEDVAGDPMWQAAKGAGRHLSRLAYVRWKPDAQNVKHIIGVKVRRDSNEIIILPRCDEGELSHVLSRIIELNR